MGQTMYNSSFQVTYNYIQYVQVIYKVHKNNFKKINENKKINLHMSPLLVPEKYFSRHIFASGRHDSSVNFLPKHI